MKKQTARSARLGVFLLILAGLTGQPGAARADGCPGGESHLSPGDTAHTVGAAPVVAATCPITLYLSEDDPERFLTLEGLTISAQGAPQTFVPTPQAAYTDLQPMGCWESDPPPVESLEPDQLLERTWAVWQLAGDAPWPVGPVEVLHEGEVVARFEVAADAVGCAESTPPDISTQTCSPGVQDCGGGEPSESADVGPAPLADGEAPGEVADVGPGGDAAAPDAAVLATGDDAGGGCQSSRGAASGARALPIGAALAILAVLAARRRGRSPGTPSGGQCPGCALERSRFSWPRR